MRPADGERSAIVGFSGQFGLAARIVMPKLPFLEWIRVADPAAGVADDFQFKAGPVHHALQVKWSQYPDSFSWSALVSPVGDKPALLTGLAAAWKRIRARWDGPLALHLCTNDHASASSPPAATPLAHSTAAKPRHFAAFIARSFRPVRDDLRGNMIDWTTLAATDVVNDWAPAWNTLRAASGLGDDDFVGFIRDFEMHFDLTLNVVGTLEDRDPDVAALAAEFQAIVAGQARVIELSCDELLDRLGWSHRLRYRNLHQFPIPAVYTANEAARTAIEVRLGELGGGYLALVGPAGSGKSTLLSSLQVKGTVVRYYAFVPDAPDPLSGRGEAESFLHDVSLLLHSAGHWRGASGTDIRSQRLVLSDQIVAAGRQWAATKQPTTIIIDGLDHVVREQSPTQSMLQVLPGPAAIPDGVYLVLGTQTIDILPEPVRVALESGSRIIDLPALAPREVREIASRAGLAENLLPGQMNQLVEVSEGHPLALTYLISEIHEIFASNVESVASVHAVLSGASAYGGDIGRRYGGYLRGVRDSPEALELLAVVARLRGSVNLRWLASWARKASIDAFVADTATFVHRADDDWRFIHNSFRRFLVEETASIGATFSEDRDRQLHSQLADRCAASGDWPHYRNEALAHRFLAGDYRQVVETATAGRLRQLLNELWPLSAVRDHATLALRAAAELRDYAAFTRLLLFTNELWLREHILEPEKLAQVLVEIDPDLALDHITRGSALRISPEAATKYAARYAEEGRTNAARSILRACGGLAGLIERHDGGRYRSDWAATIADWAKATWHLSGQREVLSALDHHLPVEPIPLTAAEPDVAADHADWQSRRREEDQAEWAKTKLRCRFDVLQRCAELASAARDDDALDQATALVDALDYPELSAWVRLRRAITDAEDGDADRVLHWTREILAISTTRSDDGEEDEEQFPDSADVKAVSLHLRSRAAIALASVGLLDADEVEALVPLGTAVRVGRHYSSGDGFEPHRTPLRLRTIRHLRAERTPKAETDPAPTGTQIHGPGAERFHRARDLLGDLEAQLFMAQAGRGESPPVAALSDPIVRLLEISVSPRDEWAEWHSVRGAAGELFARLIDLAYRCGSTELIRLLDRFSTAWNDPDRCRYWSPLLEHKVLQSAVEYPDGRAWVLDQLRTLGQQLETSSESRTDRVERWLVQATLLARCGDNDGAWSAARVAVRSSVGLGFHDEDRHLTQCVDWLEAAALDRSFDMPRAIHTYAARILNAPEDAGRDAEQASERLVQLAFRDDPALACTLAEHLCEVGKMSSASSIASLAAAASTEPAVPPMLTAAVAVHLLLPVAEVVPFDLLSGIRAAGGEVATLIDRAAAVWSQRRKTQESDEASGSRTPVPPPQPSLAVAPTTTPGGLLREMRALRESTRSVKDWHQVIELARLDTASAPIVRALLAEANRLRVVGAGMGKLISRAVELGVVAEAEGALRCALTQCPTYGWLRHMDGGSRISLLESALSTRRDELVQVAAQDLALSLSSGGLRDWLRPDDLRRIVALIGGADGVPGAWGAICEYLDVIAPATHEGNGFEIVPAASATEALTRWATGYLGHPVRPLDFGARKVMQAAMRVGAEASAPPIAEAINRTGWSAEAALLAVATTRPLAVPTDESPLTAAITAATASPDALCRFVARRIARRWQLTVLSPQAIDPPAIYDLELLPLPHMQTPALNFEGVPHVDVTDPRQVIAPFDDLVDLIADMADVDHATAAYRAASLGTAAAGSDPWLRTGHYAHAERLKRRQEKHRYRPWAYMVGRRAVGLILAEFVDSGRIDSRRDMESRQVVFELLNDSLMHVELEPRDASMPEPWRPTGADDYSKAGWIESVHEAAQVYGAVLAKQHDHFVLAERTEWRAGSWGKLTERRIVSTSTSTARGTTDDRPFEDFRAPSDVYPAGASDERIHGETAVRATLVNYSDPRWERWLALHPAVAKHLRWSPDESEPFAWRGSDGQLRARTVLRQIGNSDHRAPGWNYAAFGWQVLLTPIGKAELLSGFGTVRRTVLVKRTAEEDRGDYNTNPTVARAAVDVA